MDKTTRDGPIRHVATIVQQEIRRLRTGSAVVVFVRNSSPGFLLPHDLSGNLVGALQECLSGLTASERERERETGKICYEPVN